MCTDRRGLSNRAPPRAPALRRQPVEVGRPARRRFGTQDEGNTMKPRDLAPFLIFPLLASCSFGAVYAEPRVPTEPIPTEPMELGRLYTRWFLEGETDFLWDRMTRSLQSVFGDRDHLNLARAEFLLEEGQEMTVTDEFLIPWLGSTIYHRSARHTLADSTVWIQWAIRPDGRADGFLVQEEVTPAPTSFLAYETRARLRLPFNGEWFVFWGGESVPLNFHAAYPDQRFATDFVIARGGRSYTGDRTANSKFYCWGEPVLAPAPGTVVTAVDGIPDNVPGETNDSSALGNHVILDLGDNEYAFLAHLQQGSVRARPGDRVERGEQIGSCGNSGTSSEPLVHFHLQNTPIFGEGAGLPAQFENYVADSWMMTRGEPRRGQTVTPAS